MIDLMYRAFLNSVSTVPLDSVIFGERLHHDNIGFICVMAEHGRTSVRGEKAVDEKKPYHSMSKTRNIKN